MNEWTAAKELLKASTESERSNQVESDNVSMSFRSKAKKVLGKKCFLPLRHEHEVFFWFYMKRHKKT